MKNKQKQAQREQFQCLDQKASVSTSLCEFSQQHSVCELLFLGRLPLELLLFLPKVHRGEWHLVLEDMVRTSFRKINSLVLRQQLCSFCWKDPSLLVWKILFFFYFLHNISVLVKSWLHSSVHVHVRSLSLKTARIRKKNDVRVIQIQCSTAIIYKTKHLSWLSSRVICIWQLWSTAGFLLSAHRIESPLLLVQKWILVRLEVSLQSLFLSVKLWKEVQLHVPFSLMTCK